jgi:galactokinase
MTGGGFGGSAIALVERGKAEVVAARVDETMKDRFGSRFGAGPRSFKVTPSAGARAWRIGLSER